MPHAPFRLLRTSLVATTIMGLAAGAHLLGGGSLPAPAIMVAILALHILCSTLATKFRLSLPTMVLLLATSQTVLHQGFEVLSHGAHAVSTGPDLGAHHNMGAQAHAALMLAQATPGADIASHAGTMSAAMWAGHIGATLSAAALLAYGENVLWSLANWLRPLYRCAAVVLVMPTQNKAAPILSRPLPSLPWRNVPPDMRRGPPLRQAIFA